MNFKQRLLRYLVGIGIGLALVFLFFGPRGCGKWLPGNQVKKWIRENNKNIEIDLKTSCYMKCLGLQDEDIFTVLSEEGNGEVLFEESQTKGYPKTYIIKGEREPDVSFKFGFTLRNDSSSIVSSAVRLDQEIECDCPKK